MKHNFISRLPAIISSIYAIAFLSFIGLGAYANASEHVPKRDTVTLPAFTDLTSPSSVELYSSDIEYEVARTDSDYIFERLTYEVDGLDVVAFVYRSTIDTKPRPTVIFNRGSYIRDDAAPEYLTLFHRFAVAGYTVIAPMYRGSEGAPGHDEMGGADLNDLMAIPKLIAGFPSVDSDNLFLYGESRGGMMVLQALRDGFPARAAAVFGAFTNLEALVKSKPQYGPMADLIWPGWKTKEDTIFPLRSAVKWADKINAPVLIMHGGNDQSVPVEQSLNFAKQLDNHDKPYQFIIYAYDNHVLTENSVKRDSDTSFWFAKHMVKK